jgi:uncharacterized protein (DUF2267 family)
MSTGFLNSFYAHFEKSTSAIKRRTDLKVLKETLEKALDRSGTWVMTSSFATGESDASKFLILIDDAGFHILNQKTQAHTLLDASGHFQSKVGGLSIPVSISIIEQDFFSWVSLYEKSLILHHTAKSARVPQKAIKEQDILANTILTTFGIKTDTPLTSPAKTQSLKAAITFFIETLSTSTATNAIEEPTMAETLTKVAEKANEVAEKMPISKPQATSKTTYLLPSDIESFIKTEQLSVGGVTCQFNCLLDLSLAFHQSNGFKRLSSIMEVLFLGIPCRQEKGEIIREPISSKWNDVTSALQALSQTLYTLKNTLEIENAEKILAQIPLMATDERKKLQAFAKAAYSFVSWYRSAFDFSLAQQDMWEKLAVALAKEPVPSAEPAPQMVIATIEHKPTRTYKKKELVEAAPKRSHPTITEVAPEPVFSGAVMTPTYKILSLRKMI